MAKKHTFKYLKKTPDGVKTITETRELVRSQAIQYHCLDCAGGSTVDVKTCGIITCLLWCFRPYQK